MPVTLNPHLSLDSKDVSRPIYEPPAEIPSRANNGLSANGRTVTWKLKSGVKWSDGRPFTAKDIAFTYQRL